MNRLIFDRTITDVENATLKGQYNASDLNRVEEWCDYLKTELNTAGYPISFTTKTNWTQSDMRTANEMERIRTNIKKLMQGFYYLTNIESNAEHFDYIKANNWEKILYEIYYLYFGTANYYVYGGIATGGEPLLWQHRFMQLTQGASLPTVVHDTNYLPSVSASDWTFDTTTATAEPDENAEFTYTNSYGTFRTKNVSSMYSTSRTSIYPFTSSTTYCRRNNSK